MPQSPRFDRLDLHPAIAQCSQACACAGRARVANSWLRLGSCVIVAAVAAAVVGNLWPIYWVAGLAPVLFIDRKVFQRLQRRCEAGDAPQNLNRLFGWTVAQSIYGNLVAAMLWFSPYVPGETLAVIYMCGGLANAAATLRAGSIPSAGMPRAMTCWRR